jgi:F0F1-type ATP synthase membrane subunit b/b'
MNMTAKAKKMESVRKVLPRRVHEFQRTMEKEISKRWDAATDLLPPAPRKALKRLTTNVEQARRDLRKRGDRLVAEARKRAEHVTGEVRKRFEGAFEPLSNRLDVASRSEVARLQRRVHELERRLEARAHSGTPA